jgi:hypothetical protein
MMQTFTLTCKAGSSMPREESVKEKRCSGMPDGGTAFQALAQWVCRFRLRREDADARLLCMPIAASFLSTTARLLMAIKPTPRHAPHTTAAHEISEEAGASQAGMGPMPNDEWSCALAHKIIGNNEASRTENGRRPSDQEQKVARRDARKRSFPSAFTVDGRAHIHAEWRRKAA